MANGRRWTPEEDAYLRGAMRRGISTMVISEELGRTVTSAAGRADRLGIKTSSHQTRWLDGEPHKRKARAPQSAAQPSRDNP